MILFRECRGESGWHHILTTSPPLRPSTVVARRFAPMVGVGQTAIERHVCHPRIHDTHLTTPSEYEPGFERLPMSVAGGPVTGLSMLSPPRPAVVSDFSRFVLGILMDARRDSRPGSSAEG